MEQEEFLKQAEDLNRQKAEATLDRRLLDEQVAILKQLQAGAKESHAEKQEFKDLCVHLEHVFNGSPPIKFLEDLVSWYKSKGTEIERRILPDMLGAAGLREVTTTAGDKVTIRERVTAALVDEQAFTAWAEANGCADIIKYKFSIRKGEDMTAIRKSLGEIGVTYTEGLDKQGFSQSLGKLARDLMEDGKPLPPPTALSVSIFEEAKLK